MYTIIKISLSTPCVYVGQYYVGQYYVGQYYATLFGCICYAVKPIGIELISPLVQCTYEQLRRCGCADHRWLPLSVQ